jgi:DNA-binding NarL/FixJ family response regulator
MHKQMHEPVEEIVEPLTPREMDVLEMLAEGLSNKMIAHRLSISDHTAKFHVNSILAKLNAGTRTEAVTPRHPPGAHQDLGAQIFIEVIERSLPR